MSAEVKALIAEARSMVVRNNGLNWQGMVKSLADALEAVQQAPVEGAGSCARENVQDDAQAVDREALELVCVAEVERLAPNNQHAGDIGSSVASALLASGFLQDAAEVEARGLENFADCTEEFYPTEMFPVPSDEQYAALSTSLARSNLTLDRFSADLMRRAAGLARLAAQQVREGKK